MEDIGQQVPQQVRQDDGVAHGKDVPEVTVVIGKHSFSADLGVVQGGVLSPMLFNIYLEEALGTTEKLKEMVRRGDLLAFADDMLILTNSKAEMT